MRKQTETMSTSTPCVRLLSARDLTAILGSRALAYRLFNTGGFPVVELGKRKFVREDSFEDWIGRHEGKRVEVGKPQSKEPSTLHHELSLSQGRRLRKQRFESEGRQA